MKSLKSSKIFNQIIFKSRLVFLLIFLLCFLIILKIIIIQTIQGKKWKNFASQNYLKYKPIFAKRGDIYSSNNNLLATSLPFFKLAIDPFIIDNKLLENNIDQLCHKLSYFFKDHSSSYYKNKILKARKKKKRYLIINKRNINYFEKKQIIQWPIFSLGRSKGGIILEIIDKRIFPFNNMSKRTLGFINQNKKGAGIEFSFDKELRGKNGKALFQKTVGGWRLQNNNSNTISPIQGKNLETTIDTNIQDISEDYLKQALEESEADHGWVIVMKVRTGEILSLVNLSRTEDGQYKERYNYAIGKQRDPGSTFKIVSMMALLDKTDLKLADKVDTEEGIYNIYDKKIKDWNWRKGGFGIMTAREVIEKSSNIGIAKLVQNAFGHNPSMFTEYIKKTGITNKLNLQILGEAIPVIKNPSQKSWSGVTLSWMSHGYEIEFAPIHILAFYNGIANDGKIVKPMIIKKIVDNNNNNCKVFKPEILKSRICTPKTLKKIHSLLEGVVENGGAKIIKKGIYKISGKSGTAQIHGGGKYRSNSWYVSFVGYFPRQNPKYTCLVGIENPKGYKQYGSDLAAPVLRKIADRIAIYDKDNYPKIQKEINNPDCINESLPMIKGGLREDIIFLCKKFNLKYYQNSKYQWIRTSAAKDNKLILFDRLPLSYKIPNLIGLTLKDCLYILETKKINYEIIIPGNRLKSIKIIENQETKKFKLQLFCC